MAKKKLIYNYMKIKINQLESFEDSNQMNKWKVEMKSLSRISKEKN